MIHVLRTAFSQLRQRQVENLIVEEVVDAREQSFEEVSVESVAELLCCRSLEDDIRDRRPTKKYEESGNVMSAGERSMSGLAPGYVAIYSIARTLDDRQSVRLWHKILASFFLVSLLFSLTPSFWWCC